MLSQQIEEYMEALGKLEERGEKITTSSLARQRGVSAPSTTEMLGRLAERGFISYRPRGEIELTEDGRTLARTVMRRHRLWERFLHDILGVRWDRVHGEACRLEHATSPEVEQGLARAIGDSALCPHGHLIPGTGGDVSPLAGIPLPALMPGSRARVTSVGEDDSEILTELAEAGLLPGALVEGPSPDPSGLGLILLVNGEPCTVSSRAAGAVWVVPEESVGSTEMEPLAHLIAGQTGVVQQISAGRTVLARFLAMGFTPGTPVTVVQNRKSGPLLVRVRDARVALGRNEAHKIQVSRGTASDDTAARV